MPELMFGDATRMVLVETTVVETLDSWRQLRTKNEAGGILIGYRRQAHLHVVDCTIPFLKDKRSRLSFYRQDEKHSQVAYKYWNRTESRGYYLGEWHTHPENYPQPSAIDRNAWKRLGDTKLGFDLLFVIVGRQGWYVERDSRIQSLLK